jgi:hypothetical protein
MPILAGRSGWDRSRLLELLRSQQEGVLEILERIEKAEVVWSEPMSRLTARELLTDVARLGEGALSSTDLDERRLFEIVNVQYDAILAGIDLLKSHSDDSKVPRRSP